MQHNHDPLGTTSRHSKNSGFNYSITMDFETVQLPPFKDILVLARKCPVGMVGITKCMGLMTPDGFDLIEIEDENVEAILINRQITRRFPVAKVIEILKAKVFPTISQGEIVRINFHIKIMYDRLEGFLELGDED
ncbi:MAG: hypothetical protein HQM02_01810 [Magnetococcales bacterium]|nr:hypothetical protein [Magnetococcales bacterium]